MCDDVASAKTWLRLVAHVLESCEKTHLLPPILEAICILKFMRQGSWDVSHGFAHACEVCYSVALTLADDHADPNSDSSFSDYDWCLAMVSAIVHDGEDRKVEGLSRAPCPSPLIALLRQRFSAKFSELTMNIVDNISYSKQLGLIAQGKDLKSVVRLRVYPIVMIVSDADKAAAAGFRGISRAIFFHAARHCLGTTDSASAQPTYRGPVDFLHRLLYSVPLATQVAKEVKHVGETRIGAYPAHFLRYRQDTWLDDAVADFLITSRCLDGGVVRWFALNALREIGVYGGIGGSWLGPSSRASMEHETRDFAVYLRSASIDAEIPEDWAAFTCPDSNPRFGYDCITVAAPGRGLCEGINVTDEPDRDSGPSSPTSASSRSSSPFMATDEWYRNNQMHFHRAD